MNCFYHKIFSTRYQYFPLSNSVKNLSIYEYQSKFFKTSNKLCFFGNILAFPKASFSFDLSFQPLKPTQIFSVNSKYLLLESYLSRRFVSLSFNRAKRFSCYLKPTRNCNHFASFCFPSTLFKKSTFASVAGASSVSVKKLKEANIGKIPTNFIEKVEPEISVQKSHNPEFFVNLPIWSRTKKAPFSYVLLSLILIIPCWIFAFIVHILPELGYEDFSRDIMAFHIHSVSSILTFMGSVHFGLQMSNIGTPKGFAHKGLYNTLRLGFSITPLVIGLLASAISAAYPRDAIYLQLIGFLAMIITDWIIHMKCLCPAWFFRQRFIFSAQAITTLLLLVLSECQLDIGRQIRIKM